MGIYELMSMNRDGRQESLVKLVIIGSFLLNPNEYFQLHYHYKQQYVVKLAVNTTKIIIIN